MQISGVWPVVTGMPAPPPQPSQAASGVAVATTGPVASAPGWAVQQGAQVTQTASGVGRRVPAEPNHGGRMERLKDARLAWMDGKPGKAPAVWPMFPASDAEDDGKGAFTARIRSLTGKPAEATPTEELIEAVKVVRGDTPEASAVALGVA